jgi:hypothetical protein
MRSRNPPMPSINSVKSSAVFSNRCYEFSDSSRRGVFFRYPMMSHTWDASVLSSGFPFMMPAGCSGSRERSFRDRTWP